MVEESKYGQMGQDTMASGKMILLKVMADWFTWKVMSMKDNGKMIKQMASVSIPITMVTDMLVIGRKTNNMAKVLRSGPMTHNMMGIISLAWKKVKESSLGRMEAHIWVIFTKIIFMAKVFINGVKTDNITASGLIIRWKVRVPWHGKIRGNILVDSRMTIVMDGERWNGQMGATPSPWH